MYNTFLWRPWEKHRQPPTQWEPRPTPVSLSSGSSSLYCKEQIKKEKENIVKSEHSWNRTFIWFSQWRSAIIWSEIPNIIIYNHVKPYRIRNRIKETVNTPWHEEEQKKTRGCKTDTIWHAGSWCGNLIRDLLGILCSDKQDVRPTQKHGYCQLRDSHHTKHHLSLWWTIYMFKWTGKVKVNVTFHSADSDFFVLLGERQVISSGNRIKRLTEYYLCVFT